MFVTQDVHIFADTVLENVRLWNELVSREEVSAACGRVGAASIIDRLPQGYDTIVGEGGIGLSLGERQLVSMARVLMRQPSLLILDEPSAHVDLRTEERILGALESVFKERTIILIAHRLSAPRNVERTIVLDKGRIVKPVNGSFGS